MIVLLSLKIIKYINSRVLCLHKGKSKQKKKACLVHRSVIYSVGVCLKVKLVLVMSFSLMSLFFPLYPSGPSQ